VTRKQQLTVVLFDDQRQPVIIVHRNHLLDVNIESD
jgi:hypothetical protein